MPRIINEWRCTLESEFWQLCWQISIQAVGIPVQHIFYEDLAGNSANLEARISQIPAEIQFMHGATLALLLRPGSETFLETKHQLSSSAAVEGRAADAQLGLPKLRVFFSSFGPLLEFAYKGRTLDLRWTDDI